MCVCAVGSLARVPMIMNGKYGKCDDDGQRNHYQPHYDFTERPPYKFYQNGITEEPKGWPEAFFTLARNARGIQIVTVAVVLTLCYLACEFLEKGSNNLSYRSIIGTLLVALMIFIIGLISLRRTEDTDAKQKEEREKNKDESAKSGAGGTSQSQDRRPSKRNGSSNPNGGGK